MEKFSSSAVPLISTVPDKTSSEVGVDILPVGGVLSIFVVTDTSGASAPVIGSLASM